MADIKVLQVEAYRIPYSSITHLMEGNNQYILVGFGGSTVYVKVKGTLEYWQNEIWPGSTTVQPK